MNHLIIYYIQMELILFLDYIKDKSKTSFIKEFWLNENLARIFKLILFHILTEDRMYSYLSYIKYENLYILNPPILN